MTLITHCFKTNMEST